MADIQIPYLPATGNGDFDLKLQEVIDILRYYVSEHDTSLATLEAALTWTEISSFTNSWVNYGSPYHNAAYSKNVHNVVRLRGVIKNGTDNQPAFTLPSGYRPASDLFFAVGTALGASGRIIVGSDGTVDPHAADSGTTLISLDNISFHVA